MGAVEAGAEAGDGEGGSERELVCSGRRQRSSTSNHSCSHSGGGRRDEFR